MVEKWEAVVYTHVREQAHSKGLLLGTNAITSSHFEPCGWEVFTVVMTWITLLFSCCIGEGF
jgi:hypothetical protein